MKRVICGAMAVAMTVSLVGCGAGEKGKTEDGKTLLVVSGMPDKEKQAESYEAWIKNVEKFEKANPDIKVEGDTWGFAVDTYSQKAAADQLPTVFYQPFTEVKKCQTQGYIKNVTKWFKEFGYEKNLNDKILDLVTGTDGDYYCVPTNAYVLGLLCNRSLFEKAGLLNDDGTVKFPKTFDELAKDSKIIKEKTGAAGFTLPTKNCCGGWMFMNIARSFGVVFMEEDKDGKWHAKFNDENGQAALQYLKDLKWKYNGLSNNALIDNPDMYKMFATEQTASIFSAGLEIGTSKTLCLTNGLDMNKLSLTSTPAGPKGKYALMGGGIQTIPANATDDQAEAAFRWLKFQGYTAEYTDESRQSAETTYQQYVKEGVPFLAKEPYSIWKSGDRYAKGNEVLAKYSQLDMKYFNSYYDDMKDIKIVPEEPYYCQELYALLDECIQEVITNKDADVKALLDDKVQNFQSNYLDTLVTGK